MERILIIDDDTELCELLRAYLEEESFRLVSEHTAAAGLSRIKDADVALVVLDVMLPDMNGFDVLTRIRSNSNLPVIMLTGRGEEVDRVVGLEMGADDYVAKPFPLRELLARIRAVLRRSPAQGSSEAARPPVRDRLEFGALSLKPGAQQARVEGKSVNLTSAEFFILEQLALTPGVVVEREELMEKALGRNSNYDDYVLNVHMSNLRRKLGQAVSIKTIRGRGYLLATAGAEA
ncbi:MAG: response regulator transcription factor [Desulfovibrionaceae bacterium]|jgi:DNA-binding response OmpR family regulator